MLEISLIPYNIRSQREEKINKNKARYSQIKQTQGTYNNSKTIWRTVETFYKFYNNVLIVSIKTAQTNIQFCNKLFQEIFSSETSTIKGKLTDIPLDWAENNQNTVQANRTGNKMINQIIINS